MARKRNPDVVEQTLVNTEVLNEGMQSLAVVSGSAAKVAEMLGYELQYNQERIVQEARFYMGQSAEAMLEAGKRLVILKENEGHGEFIQIVEERLGIQARTAQLMMQAAVKYLTNPALESKAKTFSLLGKSKLFELMTLDDDQLKELAEGGTVADLTLDEVDRMSVRELKAALRESRENAAATDKVLASKNKKIDQLAAELERKKGSTPAEEWEWAPLRRGLIEACESVSNFAHSELRRALLDIQEKADQGDGLPEEMSALQAQALAAAMQSLVSLQQEYRIDVDLESMVTPPWLADSAKGSK
jgi:hypothetical protein